MENALKKRIMRRVYTIWFVRKVTPLAGECAGLLILFGWGLQYISPMHILANAVAAADSINAPLTFFSRAFTNLSAPSQFALVAAGILATLIVRDIWLQGERLLAMRSRLTLVS